MDAPDIIFYSVEFLALVVFFIDLAAILLIVPAYEMRERGVI